MRVRIDNLRETGQWFEDREIVQWVQDRIVDDDRIGAKIEIWS